MQYFLDVWRQAVDLAKEVTLGYFGKSPEELGMITKLDDARFADDHQKSPVTLADQQAEQAIKQHLKKHFPEHGFIGEEEGEERSEADYKRIIDPIDGTRNFARWLPYWAILLALSYRDEIIVAIVCMPVMGDIIWATKWGGTLYNGKQVHVSTHTLSESYLAHNRHTYFTKVGKEHQFNELCKQVRYTKSCISREMAYVATGGFDVAINIGGNYYDNAPIALLVTEAGGTVTTLSWGVFGQADTSMIVSNGVVHDEVVEMLNR